MPTLVYKRRGVVRVDDADGQAAIIGADGVRRRLLAIPGYQLDADPLPTRNGAPASWDRWPLACPAGRG